MVWLELWKCVVFSVGGKNALSDSLLFNSVKAELFSRILPKGHGFNVSVASAL
jgi:hypothetical protein